VPTPFPDPGAALALSFGTIPNVIVDDVPQPPLLAAVVSPELPLSPELEFPRAPESPVDADPLLEPEAIGMPELDVEPLPGVPELDPLPWLGLPELDALPKEELAASLSGELPLVELLPHAPAITARHTRHPVIAARGRTPVLAISMFTPSLSRSGSHRRNPLRKAGMLEGSSVDRQIRSGCRGRSLDPSRSSLGKEIVAVAHGARAPGRWTARLQRSRERGPRWLKQRSGVAATPGPWKRALESAAPRSHGIRL
jgi:hypothetical protein